VAPVAPAPAAPAALPQLSVREQAKALPVVRRFLIDFRVNWPNVMNGTGGEDFAKAYGVSEIPANFLVDRDGKISRVELSGEDLEKAVAEAVGAQKGEKGGSASR